MSLSNACCCCCCSGSHPAGPWLHPVIDSPSVSWWCYCCKAQVSPKKVYLMISLLICRLYHPSIHKHHLKGGSGKERPIELWWVHTQMILINGRTTSFHNTVRIFRGPVIKWLAGWLKRKKTLMMMRMVPYGTRTELTNYATDRPECEIIKNTYLCVLTRIFTINTEEEKDNFPVDDDQVRPMEKNAIPTNWLQKILCPSSLSISTAACRMWWLTAVWWGPFFAACTATALIPSIHPHPEALIWK